MTDLHLELNNLSPTGIIGFWILFIGMIFTGAMFFFVFFRLSDDDDSYKDKQRKKIEKERQKDKIARLYPKNN